MSVSRRNVLAASLGTAGLLVTPALRLKAQPVHYASDPFTLGVASGYPEPDAVTLRSWPAVNVSRSLRAGGRMTESRVSRMPQGGSVLAALGLIVALLIGALYYFAYLPQREALVQARLAAAAANDAAVTARREAGERAEDAEALRAQVEDLEGMLDELRQTSAGLAAEVRQREEQIAAIRSTEDELVSVLQMEITSGQIQVERMRDSLRVDLVNEILFDSGEAELKPAGVEVLTRVGEILKNATDRQIVVQGHTDFVTIGGRLAQRYATNCELSSARAV